MYHVAINESALSGRVSMYLLNDCSTGPMNPFDTKEFDDSSRLFMGVFLSEYDSFYGRVREHPHAENAWRRGAVRSVDGVGLMTL
jgi:hypothetical protein